MRRVRLPDPRCLANVDFPILPFLAPRLLAKSPFRTGVPRHDARISTSTKEEKEEAAVHGLQRDVGVALRSPSAKSSKDALRKRRTVKIARSDALASASLASRISSSRHFSRPSASVSRRSDLSQVDISSPHLDHPETQQSQTPLRRRLVLIPFGSSTRKARHSSIRIRSLSPYSESHNSRCLTATHRQAAHGSLQGHTKRCTTRVGLTATINRRRLRSLRQELKRFTTFMSYKPRVAASGMMDIGRYRSLRRRIYNLRRRKPEELDLEQDIPLNHTKFATEILTPVFAALDRRVYPSLKKSTHWLKLRHNPRCGEWVEKLCQEADTLDQDQMRNNWMHFDKADRDRIWHLLVFYFLDTNPARALQFIEVLSNELDDSPWKKHIIADALEHLSGICLQRQVPWHQPLNKAMFIPLFCNIFENYLYKITDLCSQDLLRNVAKIATAVDLKRIFDLLVEKKSYVAYDTFLHYANFFANHAQYENAIICLREISARINRKEAQTEVVNRRRFQWTCANILRRSVTNGSNYHMTPKIVADYLAMGVKLEILLYNVVMHNAMEAGDYTTAFRIYNILGENEVTPDKYTYSILLHGCTMSENPAMFQEFATQCAAKARELGDGWLATDCLYYQYVCHQKDDPEHFHTKMANVYAELFSSAALEPFLDPIDSTKDERESENLDNKTCKPEPPSCAVYIMLQMQIKKALSIGNLEVWKLCQYFKRIVEDGKHPAMTQIAKDPIIWNAFLLAFCKNQQFEYASRLIKSMTDGFPKGIPQPNVFSWNIFMQSFFKTDQVRAAERIHEIMLSRGVEPDQYTYGVMLMGYAKAQHIEKLGEVMKHVRDEEQLQPTLLQSLMRVRDRHALMAMLADVRRGKEEKAREETQRNKAEKAKEMALHTLKPVLSTPRLSLSEASRLTSESTPLSLPSPSSWNSASQSTVPVGQGSDFTSNVTVDSLGKNARLSATLLEREEERLGTTSADNNDDQPAIAI